MSNPASWVLGHFLGAVIAAKRQARHKHNRVPTAMYKLRKAEAVYYHLQACHAEITRLGGSIPYFHEKLRSTKGRPCAAGAPERRVRQVDAE